MIHGELDPDAYVALHSLFRLFEHVLVALREPALPILLARQLHVEDFHLMGYAIMTASSGRESVERAIRYMPFITNSTRWTLVHDKVGVRVRFTRDLPLSLGHRAANEMALADFLQCSRQTSHLDLCPLSVSFQHPAPSTIEAHQRFFRCPLEFGAPHNEITISHDFLAHTPSHANPGLSRYFREQMEHFLDNAHSDRGICTQVRRVIEERLPSGEPYMTDVARSLGTTERTLRRRLRSEGVRFAELLTEVRRDKACSLLTAPAIPLAEIAYILGFSHVNAFSRAFKRWTDRTPSEYRRSYS